MRTKLFTTTLISLSVLQPSYAEKQCQTTPVGTVICSDVSTPTPTTNKAPTASFTVSPGNGTAPLTVTLDASNSSDSDGSITNYAWASSDGRSANGKSTSFTFSQAGTFNITLTVTDNGGLTHQTSHEVTVAPKQELNKAPTASFTVNPGSGTAPLKVTLDASSSSDSDGSITNYAWTSSDGQSANGKNTSFTFSQAETFTITLTVTDNGGLTHQTSQVVTVSKPALTCTAPQVLQDNQCVTPNQAPNALIKGITYNQKTGIVTLDATGSSDIDGSVTQYEWLYKEEVFKSTAEKNSTFGPLAKALSPDQYPVELRVTDDKGKPSSVNAKFTLTVQAPAQAQAAFTIAGNNDLHSALIAKGGKVTVDASIAKASAPDRKITRYAWNSVDSVEQTSSAKETTFTFNAPGQHLISLTVTDDNGAEDTVVRYVTVKEALIAPDNQNDSGNHKLSLGYNEDHIKAPQILMAGVSPSLIDSKDDNINVLALVLSHSYNVG